jgi:flagellar hook-basal body complex protein FliE
MISPVSNVNVGGVGGGLGAGRLAGPADPSTEGAGFGNQVGTALDRLDAAEQVADSAAIGAATGNLSSVSDYMVASTEAQLMTEVTVAVRNRAIESFNEIMRMQV